ncbi:Uncharacterized protein QTN25_002661 [Entamoeba marina]
MSWFTEIKCCEEFEQVLKSNDRFVLFCSPPNCRKVKKVEFDRVVPAGIQIFHIKYGTDRALSLKTKADEYRMCLTLWEKGEMVVNANTFYEFRRKLENVINYGDYSTGLDPSHWMKLDNTDYLNRLHHRVVRMKTPDIKKETKGYDSYYGFDGL